VKKADPTLSIHNTTRRNTDTALFVTVKQLLLPKDYTLSVVLCGDARVQKLNKTYRQKEYTPNVLSFPVAKNEGEIFLNLAQIAREAARYQHTPKEHLHYLLIHGCLHLDGYGHSSTMERAECRAMQTLFPSYTCN